MAVAAGQTRRPMTPDDYAEWWSKAPEADIQGAMEPSEYDEWYAEQQAEQRQPRKATRAPQRPARTAQARSAPRVAGGWNGSKIGAVLTSIISWITTYWCVLWIMQPADDASKAIPIVVSIVAEVVLILMKRCLFTAGDHGIGWAGFTIDAIINAGGILPRAGRLLTFPPIAAMLAVIGVNAADSTANNIGAFIIALLAGALLSVLPHRLWRSGE